MSEKPDKFWLGVKRVGILIGVIMGLGTLGFVLPWDAASKESVREYKVENKTEHEEFKEHDHKQERAISNIEGKLDTIIEMLKK